MATKIVEVEFEEVNRWRLFVWADRDRLCKEMAERLRSIEGVTSVSDWFAGKEYFISISNHGEIHVDPRYYLAEIEDEITAVILEGKSPIVPQ